MHRPTRLDTQQSECHNSLEHTFFSPGSPNIMLKEGNLESRPPHLLLHCDEGTKKKRKETMSRERQEMTQEAVSVAETPSARVGVNGGRRR